MENSKTNLDQLQLTDYSSDYRARALFSMVPCHKDWSLLDLGSGNGEIANFLRGRLAQITLSDHSEILLSSLRKKFKNRSDVVVRHIDVRLFSTTETQYDIITACDLIEHLKDDLSCLRYCFQQLKPGGFLFVSVPALPFLYGRRDKKIGHYRRYTKNDLRNKLTTAGFTIKDLRYWNLIGVVPYLVSEKIFKKELVGPARQIRNKKDRVVNSLLSAVLKLETTIPILPAGLSLVTVSKKANQ